MAKDVRLYVTSCVTCQARKQSSTTKQMQLPVRPPALWERMYIDLLDMHVTTSAGNRYLFVAVEGQTGWCYVKPIASKTADACVRCAQEIVYEVGRIPQWHSDRGKEFMNGIMDSFLEAMNAEPMHTSAYHPQSNGKVEQMNKQILRAVHAFIDTKQQDWDAHIPAVQFALRTQVHPVTGLSPFFMIYGREPQLPYDMLSDHRHATGTDYHERVAQMIDQHERAHDIVQQAYEGRVEAVGRLNAQIKRSFKFKVGDYVMIQIPPAEGRVAKMDPRWSGPWQLTHEAYANGATYVAKLMGRRIRFTTVHASRLKPYHERPERLRDDDTRHAGRVHRLSADDIIDRRMVDGLWEYKIKSSSDSSPHGKAHWFAESKALERLLPCELDTFHALYDLRHTDNMPQHARRKDVKAPKQSLTQEQALKKFPVGTRVARVSDTSDSAADVAYEWGEIKGYRQPYWTVAYGAHDTERMTATQIPPAIALARSLKQQKRQPVEGSNRLLVARVDEVPIRDCPIFSRKTKMRGKRVARLFTDGWDTGTIRHIMGNTSLMPASDGIVYEIQFDRDPGPRDAQLNTKTYNADLSTAKVGDWHFVERRDTANDAATTSATSALRTERARHR